MITLEPREVGQGIDVASFSKERYGKQSLSAHPLCISEAGIPEAVTLKHYTSIT